MVSEVRVAILSRDQTLSTLANLCPSSSQTCCLDVGGGGLGKCRWCGRLLLGRSRLQTKQADTSTRTTPHTPPITQGQNHSIATSTMPATEIYFNKFFYFFFFYSLLPY